MNPLFCHPTIQTNFREDAAGRLFSDGDREELALLGVARVYQADVPQSHRPDTARLIFGECHVPADAVRRPGVAYLSRQAVEKALWEFLSDGLQLARERTILLRRLRFDPRRPYEVLYDAERRLYVFLSVIAGSPVTEPTAAASPAA